MDDVIARARAVRLAVFDVDGVLTDGRLYMNDAGEEIKAFHTLDGHGLKMLRASGVELAIISGRHAKSVELRARNLGIVHLFQAVEDKLGQFMELMETLRIDPSAAAFMGDDLVDLPCMRRAGFAISVPAAPAIVRRHAHYVTAAQGGRGAVREVCEVIMRAQGTLDAELAKYLQ
ncbi:MAG: HAD-IIIA family hydrolase [Burkholderiales bacterium]|nr:HAD-IIIA family hydrolase [Burkholderiales bacterium]